MATVRKLVTKWGFQVDARPLQEMKMAVSEMKAGIMGLAVEAGAAAAAIFAFAEHTASAGKEASLAASRAGMGVEEFQRLGFVAKKAGVDSEMLTHSLAHMNRSMYEARMGNKEALQSFIRLGGGVAQSALRGAPAQVIFGQIADRIKGMNDPAKQSALAMRIFGRAGFQMLPMLKRGSAGIKELSDEADEMGVILSKDAVAASMEFKSALGEVEHRIHGIKNTIGIALLEPVTKVMRAMALWIKQNRALITQNLTSVIKGMGFAVTVAVKVIGSLIQRLNELLTPLGGVGKAAGVAFGAFAIFKSLQVVSGIGHAAQSIFDVAKAWQFMGFAAMSARVVALSIPILIGAAVLLLIAALEDIVGYFEGKDSLFGRILVGFDEMFAGLSERFAKFGGMVKGLAAVILYPFRAVLGTLKGVSGAIGSLVGGGGLSGAYGAIKDSTKDLVSPLAKIMEGDADSLSLSDVTGIASNPRASQLAGQAGAAAPANVQTAITVNVPPGTDPHLVGDRVEDGVAKGLDGILRPANRSLATGVAY